MPLYVVSLPIGNPEDITLRALETLKSVDFLICEEFKNARILMKRLGIDKELLNLNEHNETVEAEAILPRLKEGQSAALFSDCGTPLFADPGTYLVRRCHEVNLPVIPVPGASSLLSALVLSGVDSKQFYYAGFLPRKPEERRAELQRLQNFRCAVVLYDTPYRLIPLLEDLATTFATSRPISLLVSLTQPTERIFRGFAPEILQRIQAAPFKEEFVIVIEPSHPTKRPQKAKVKTRKRK